METYVTTAAKRHKIHAPVYFFRTGKLSATEWKRIYDALYKAFPNTNYCITVTKCPKYGTSIV